MSFAVHCYGPYVRGYLARDGRSVTRAKSRAKRFRSEWDAKAAAWDFKLYIWDEYEITIMYKIQRI